MITFFNFLGMEAIEEIRRDFRKLYVRLNQVEDALLSEKKKRKFFKTKDKDNEIVRFFNSENTVVSSEFAKNLLLNVLKSEKLRYEIANLLSSSNTEASELLGITDRTYYRNKTKYLKDEQETVI